MKLATVYTILSIAAYIISGGTAYAADPVWQVNGVPVCNVAGTQETPSIATLGTDGCIVAWADRRSGEYDIYVQKLDANGNAIWTAGGIRVCAALYDQQFPAIVPDGTGGAIVAWQDGRLGDAGVDIYAQRVSSDGTLLWTADGAPVCTHLDGVADPPTAFSFAVTADGSGGMIIFWRDTRNDTAGGNTELYAQKMSAAGAPQWAVNGVPVMSFSTTKWSARTPVACGDGSGGAFVAWQDTRNATTSGNDVYVQRVSSSGASQWTTNGVAVCTVTGDQAYIDLVRLTNENVVVV